MSAVEAPAQPRSTRATMAIVASQWLLVALILTGTAQPLLTAAISTGDFSALTEPYRYGRSSDWIPASPWNPLAWVLGAAAWAAMLAGGLSLLAVLFGLSQVPRTAPARRGGLIVATSACALLMLASMTGYAAELRSWLAS